MFRLVYFACFATLISGQAQAIDASPVPLARPGLTPVSAVSTLPVGIANLAVFASPFPQKRPDNVVQKRQAAVSQKVSYGKSGSVCGMRDIRGQTRSAIPAKLVGCGLSNPVLVSEISGVKLNRAATIDCTTAKALRTWIEKGAKPAVGRLGGGISELRVVASYACRTRNNQAGAKISEHGKGHAIDIAAIKLKNGVDMTVLKGWNDPLQGKVLRKMHKAACGPFGTVLGPDANKYHRDHFHFDTARYRSGSYCR